MRRADDHLKVALVTGACSGIGKAIATELAGLGYALVLVSHRPAELGDTADDLAARYGVTTHAIPVDLARPEAAAELYAAVRERGIEVDILVNNAGFLLFGEVADVDPARANALLQLHVVTPTLLVRHFGRDMRQRRRGHILIVSSQSAWKDFPGIALYGASKRYLRHFSASLRSELRVWGVNVTCLAPGAVVTGLYDPKVIDLDLGRRTGVMAEPTWVARAGLRAMFRHRAVVMPGLLTKLMTLGALLTPRWAIDQLRVRAPWLPRPP